MIRFWADEFGRLQTERQLRELLEVEAAEWLYLTEHGLYRVFQMPKPAGGFREVEDPEPALKVVLRRLNEYLQAVYYNVRTKAAFGFLLCPDNDPDPRNIRTNAQRHCNRPYLLNADFLDFFHAVRQPTVQAVFEDEPFEFSEELSAVLARLCCRNGRLPMGSPTSPVLSNFAARPLDAALLALARQQNWCFTRFADDLSFSSDTPVTKPQLQHIRQLCELEGFRFNDRKLVQYGPQDDKFVTGLLVGETVEIPDQYISTLRAEIAKLQTLTEIKFRTGQRESAWADRFEQQVAGHLRFVRFVLGPSDPGYQLLMQAFADAQKPIDDNDPMSWLDFNNYV